MSSLEEQMMNRRRLFLDQRLFSAAQEFSTEEESTLTEDQGNGLDLLHIISAALQVCLTSADGNQSVSTPATQEACLSPNEELVICTSSKSAEDMFFEETKQGGRTDCLQKQDFLEEFENYQKDRDKLQIDFALCSDNSNKNLVKNGAQPLMNLNKIEPVKPICKKEQITQSRERPHCCGVCGKGFTCKSSLTSHERTHTGHRPYQCDICKKSFTQKTNLKTHKRIHTGEKPHTCDTCGKAFGRKDVLITHKYTHTGERPYSCTVCNKSFQNTSNLKTHKRTHTGEKPYSCTFCNKSFLTNSNLKKHTFIHTGEKPYVCDVCGQAFSQSRTLKYHKGGAMCCGEAPAEDDSHISDLKTEEREADFSCSFSGRQFLYDVCGQVFCQEPLLLQHQRTHC